jgi:hypothetical protein
MSAGIALRDAPRRFLGAEKWAELRSFAKSDLIALTYINAPYPDEGTPNSFFCGYEGSFEEALHCYQLGRKLVDEARQLFVQGKLMAIGWTAEGKREMIPSLAWIGLWPMFATNRARGRNIQYTEVEVFEGVPLENRGHHILRNCIDWLCTQRVENPNQPKKVLIFQAQERFGGQLTVGIFNVAYKIVYDLKRGRRRISPQK